MMQSGCKWTSRTYIFLLSFRAIGAEMLEWSGASQKSNDLWFWYGIAFLTVEVLDGFSSEWGASSGDIIANASGTALFVRNYCGRSSGSHLFFHTTQHAQYRPNVLGLTCGTNSKDYNGQTYWLSVNLHSF
jgi:hypothetical protein